jgi:hypothetical protein
MALSTPQKWLVGCGIGCAAIIVIVVALIAGAVVFVRGKFAPLQTASDSRKQVAEAYGAAEAFVPPSDGAISPDRMEIFLSVREALKGEQTRIDAALANLDFDRLNQRQPSFGSVLRILNDMSNLIAPFGEYVDHRNRALLDKRMGLGEYAYIYSIAYHSWLHHPLEEGPAILTQGRRQDRDRVFRDNPGLSPEGVHRQYRRLMLRWLENQLDGIQDVELTKWRGTLKDEMDRIDRNPGRVLWEDGFPLPIQKSLEPFRDRLTDAYHRSTNYFELLTMDEIRQFDWGGGTSDRDAEPRK